MNKNNESPQNRKKQLVRSVAIAVAAAITFIATLLTLNANMFFSSPQKKLCGEWQRTRIGQFSGEKITENYVFNKDGTGEKQYISEDGTVTENEFTWTVTKKKILVINGCVKYNYSADTDGYYSASAVTAKKYWYVTKNELCIGENTSAAYELYYRKQ